MHQARAAQALHLTSTRPLPGSGVLHALGVTVVGLSGGIGSMACSAEPRPTYETVLVAKDPSDLPPPIARTEVTTVEVELTAQEVIADLGANRPAQVWTFNGTVPGPMIRVREGDNVVVTLHNAPTSREPHSIDLHAVIGPGGGAAVTEVKPGEAKTLTFTAATPGAFLYHCAAEHAPWEHVAYGMYGVILVEPAAGLPPVDHEYYLAQSEWYLAVAATQSSEEEEEHEEAGGSFSVPPDVFVLDEAAAEREEPALFTFNGHRSALAIPELYGETVRAWQGERVRLVFGNAGPNLTSSLHVIGEIFDRVTPGSFTDVVVGEETVSVPPGSASIFEFTTPVPGAYEIVDHALFRAKRGAFGWMHVDANGQWPTDLYTPVPEPE